MADLFDMGLEEDPASDFLARERDELAGLDDDFGGLAVESTEPAESAETVEESSAAVDSNPAPLDDNFGLGLDPIAPAAVESSAVVNGIDEMSEDIMVSKSSGEETEKTIQWREERMKQIEEKDKNEEKELVEWRETAKRELEEWQARQAEQLEKHKKNNRVAEAEFVKERDETTPGNEWERISRLCDFNPKYNKNIKDVSKMRSLLLQLKQNPVERSTSSTSVA